MGFNIIGSAFGLGGGSGNAAQAAARQNAYQQFLIDQGTQDINAIFGGGTSAPQYVKAGGAATPGTTYYKQKYFGSPTGVQMRYTQYTGKPRKNMAGLFTMVPGQAYQGFQPNFYNQAANAYEQFATPQLGQQYFQANNDLTGGLASRGLLRSSAAQQGQSNLNTTFGQQQQAITDTGNQTANNMRNQVESAREAALGQLYSTANPAQANMTALNLAAGTSVPSAFPALGNAFSNILSQYALQQAYGNTPQLGFYAPQTNNISSNAGALPQNY